MRSLLPYLDAGRPGFHLKLNLTPLDHADHTSAETPIREDSSFPFVITADSNPIASHCEARVVTDAGIEVKRVFLLKQKDAYSLRKDDLLAISNVDIDRYWQSGFSAACAKNAKEGGVFFLKDQLGEAGELLRFQTLFYCRETERFFHPPCPGCGAMLHQCFDADILTRSGLLPYETSLKRYMFCPSCFETEEKPVFYVAQKEDSDPPLLKDMKALIKGFGRLDAQQLKDSSFPCATCSHHAACYGPQTMAVSRIVPFSFYPFFMMAVEAGSINAVDYLSLLSGASFEEVEESLLKKQEIYRQRRLKELRQNMADTPAFFFGGGEKHFLEVLYLKLSFLDALTRLVFSQKEYGQHPDFGLSIDRFWITLPEESGFLPLFWNYKIKLIDVGGDPLQIPFFENLAMNHRRHFLGMMWFYALLANRGQDITNIHAGINEARKGTSPDDRNSFEDFLKSGLSQVFDPQNIFWTPEKKTVSEPERNFWRRALGLGWRLLESGLNREGEGGEENFRSALEELKEEIKGNMFDQAPRLDAPLERPELAATAITAENAAISKILMKIRDRWLSEDRGKKDHSQSAPAHAVTERQAPGKTITISGRDEAFPKETGFHQTLSPVAEAVDVLETVMITSEEFKPADIPPMPRMEHHGTIHGHEGGIHRDVPEEGSLEDADLEKTVMARGQRENTFAGREAIETFHKEDPGATLHVKRETAAPKADEFLEETVVVSGKERRKVEQKEPPPEVDLEKTFHAEPQGRDLLEEASLEKTVIVNGSGQKTAAFRQTAFDPGRKMPGFDQKGSVDPDDLLEKTVVGRQETREVARSFQTPGPLPNVKSPPKKSDPDDSLDKTVVIRPGRKPDRQ